MQTVKIRRKLILLLIFMILILISFISVGFALFSSAETTSFSGKAGSTLNGIELKVQKEDGKVTGDGYMGDSIEKWNPGDVNLLNFTVQNLGSKSIDTRNTIMIFWDVDPDMAEQGIVYLYPASMSDANIRTDMAKAGGPTQNINIGLDNKSITNDSNQPRAGFIWTKIGDSLDGTGTTAETGDAFEVDYVTPDETVTTLDKVSYKIAFSPDTPTTYMSKNLVVKVMTEAKQHRNTGNDWSLVATETLNDLDVVPKNS